MGERRLRIAGGELPDGAFILGVDSHTALVLDLEAGRAADRPVSAASRSGSTAGAPCSRAASEVPIETLARRRAASPPGAARSTSATRSRDVSAARDPRRCRGRRRAPAEPLRDEMADLEGTFIAALERGDTPDRGRGAPRPRFGDRGTGPRRRGQPGPRQRQRDVPRAHRPARGARRRPARPTRARRLAPFVDALLTLRARARDARDWATADLIRDRLSRGRRSRSGTAPTGRPGRSPPDALGRTGRASRPGAGGGCTAGRRAARDLAPTRGPIVGSPSGE